LRGIAVLLVLINHLPFSVSGGGEHALDVYPAWAVPVTNFGRFGVNLFLVISGFCIHMQWARRADAQLGVGFLSFWKRRLRRRHPPYFVALVGTLAGLYVLFGVLGHAQGFAARFGYSSIDQLVIDVVLLVLLLQNLNRSPWRVGNGPFWTLALEEQLYMLY